MKAIDKSTPNTLLDIIDHINHETSFARGIVCAIRGFECLNESQREGVTMFAEAHVDQLVEIRGWLQQLTPAIPGQEAAARVLTAVNRAKDEW